MKRRGSVVFAPSNAASSLEVLMDEVATLLKMINPFNSITPLDLLAEDLGLLDFDPFLPDQMLPHLKHGNWVPIRVFRVEIIWSSLIENHSLLSPHLSPFLLLNSRFSLCISRYRWETEEEGRIGQESINSSYPWIGLVKSSDLRPMVFSFNFFFLSFPSILTRI